MIEQPPPSTVARTAPASFPPPIPASLRAICALSPEVAALCTVAAAAMVAAAAGPSWAVAVLAVLVASLWAARQPAAALGTALALAWGGPAELAWRAGGAATALSLLPFVLLAGGLASKPATPTDLARSRLASAALCAWLAIGLATILWAVQPSTAAASWIRFSAAAAVAWLAALSLRDRSYLRAAFWGWIAAGSLQAVAHLAALSQGVSGEALAGLVQIETTRDYARLAGSVGDPNRAGQLLLIALPLALDRFVGAERWTLRLCALAALPLLLWAVLRTLSRADLLALAVAASASVAYHWKRPSMKVIAGVGVLAAVLVFPRTLVERVTETFAAAARGSLDASASAQTRIPWLRDAWRTLHERTWLGAGAGGLDSPAALEREHGSLYLEVAGETGLVGLAVFAAVVVAAVRRLRSLHRRLVECGEIEHAAMTAALGFALCGYLVAGVLLRGVWTLDLWLLLACCLAVPEPARDRTSAAHRAPRDESGGGGNRHPSALLPSAPQ